MSRNIPVNTTAGLYPSVPESATQPLSYALLIGIEYLKSPAELKGCRRDALRFKHLCSSHLGIPTHQTKLLLEGDATYQGICRELQHCVRLSREGVQQFVIYYSGHGDGLKGDSREADGQDECIIPYDYESSGPLLDDSIWSYLRQLTHQAACLCVFDSCNSGTVADLEYVLRAGRLQSERGGRSCPATVISVSGCRDSQTSSVVKDQSGWNSALTSALIQTFSENGWGITLEQLQVQLTSYMEQQKLDQRPVVSASQPLDLQKKLGNLMGITKSLRLRQFLSVEATTLYQYLMSDPDHTLRSMADTGLPDLLG